MSNDSNGETFVAYGDGSSSLPVENDDYFLSEEYRTNQRRVNALSDHNYYSYVYNRSFEMNNNKNNNLYPCSFCSKSFNNQANLVRHVRVHTGEKPFVCRTCDKRFTQQSNLWKHMKIHTGVKPFKCDFCKKAFSQRANMQKHMVIHYGVKPFQCFVCEKAFTQQANLDKHMLLHTGEKPFQCCICPRKFAQRINMIKHQNFHLGLKPYSCQICGNSFTQQSNLKKHIQVHNQEKNFVCSNCSKAYNSKSSLLKHVKNCVCTKLNPIKIEHSEDDLESRIETHTVIRHEGDEFIEEVTISCNCCEREFSDEKEYFAHFSTCQGEPTNSPVQINQAKCVEVLLDEDTNSKFLVLDNNLIIKVEKPSKEFDRNSLHQSVIGM